MESRRPRLLLLMAMMAASQMAATIYLPSLPDIPARLGTTQAMAQLTLTTYFAAFTVAQLFIGPLGDAFGRRVVLLAGLSVYTAASLAAAFAPSIELLLAARVVQGAGACAGLVLTRAIVRDVSAGAESARIMAMLGMAMAVAPATAPLIGGLLHEALGWRANFVVIAIVGLVVTLVGLRRLPETLPKEERQPLALTVHLATYLRLLRHRAFMGYSLNLALLTAMFYAWLAAAPLIVTHVMGLPIAAVGLFMLLSPVGFVCGNFTSHRLVTRLGIDRLVRHGGAGNLAAVIVLAGLAAAGWVTPFALVLPLVFQGFSNGLIVPNCFAGSLDEVRPAEAGAASALTGVMQMAFVTVATFLVAFVKIDTALPAFLIMLGFSLPAQAIFFALVTRRRPPAGSPLPDAALPDAPRRSIGE